MTSAEIRQKLGQLFLIGFEGKNLSSEHAKFLIDNNLGCVILFSRNIEDPSQIAQLNNSLQSLTSKQSGRAPLFIGVDMEGGRIARFKAPFTQWPPMAVLGEINSPSLTFKFAETMGQELRAVGVNLDFAPCVDVLTNPKNPVIGDRSFGSDPELVSRMSSAVVRGLLKSGVLPCAKHFPGHGDASVDSHEDLPVLDLDMKRLEEVELVPFKKAFRARVDFVMSAHIKLPQIDPEWPATMSSKIMNGILREKLGYRNLVMTDDLEMKAISKHFGVAQAAIQSAKAGVNMFMYCSNLQMQIEGFEALAKAFTDKVVPQEHLEWSYKKVMELKKEYLMPYKPVDLNGLGKVVGHPDHLKLSKQIARKEIPDDLQT